MISSAMMTLIEDHEGVISQFDVASPEAVQKHLRNHDSDCSFFHLVQKFFFACKISFNPFSLGDCGIFASFSVNTDHLVMQIFFSPVELNIVAS